MSGSKKLPDIERLSKTVVRVLGQNPGPYTLQGTNTYLVGEHNPYILVDTGEGRELYPVLLRDALLDPTSTTHADKPHISDIILTHKHHDHTLGLPSVVSILRQLWEERHNSDGPPYQPPRIHKFPLHTPYAKLQTVVDMLKAMPGTYVPDPSGNVFHELSHGQTFPVTTSAADKSSSVLEVLHTPGHTADSICLHYPVEESLFTGDTILGHGSAIFEELGPYMGTLQKLVDFSDNGLKFGPVHPGHGPYVEEGFRQVKMYLQHRVAREQQILRRLETSPPTGHESWTTWALVSKIYAEFPRELWESAASSVDLHLRKLETEGRVECLGGDGKHTEWELAPGGD
ncbi:Metallo-hydrolase/oxidoreductase [Rhodofomes roseus]|uniref:Metallo-hydrolase/oxidoreductase n=1 Tax=Rhodofomes roseus TaxID=34475 RepID=A0ABQ8KVF3_9APHY|nr:Metallo-hydrolase/oxidoreductase [Rhodofomes roseus]KAH9842969.1 Metallo-hydrolase/oxidoreductase [Rhodofomes roseus]